MTDGQNSAPIARWSRGWNYQAEDRWQRIFAKQLIWILRELMLARDADA